MNKHIFHIALGLILLVGGCKKEMNHPPRIDITTPLGSFNKQAGDTIQVEAFIEDDNKVTDVKVSLLSSNFIEVVPGKSFSPNKKEFHLNTELVISNSKMPSGLYFLRVRAVDEFGEEARDYVGGQVNEAPLSFEKALVVTTPSSGSIKVRAIDPDLNVSPFLSVNSDLSGSVVNSRDGYFILCGSHQGDLIAYDVGSGTQLWKKDNLGNSPYPYFLGVDHDKESMVSLVKYSTKELKGMSANGNISITVDARQDHFITQASLRGDDVLLTEQEQVNNQDRELASYYANTGSLKSHKLIDEDVVHFYEAANGSFYFSGNKNGKGGIYKVLESPFSVDKIADLPGGEAKGGDIGRNGRMFVSHYKGVYEFSPPNSVSLVAPGPNSGKIAYDEVNNRIFLSKGKQLDVIGVDNGNTIQSYTFQDSVRSVQVVYNK